MKPIIFHCLVILTGFCLFGCKQTPESAGEEQAVRETPEIANLEIDPKTDPLVVGEKFSTVFSDTLNVQMYEMIMEPNDSIGLHVHPDHSVYVLEGGTMMVYVNGTDAVEMKLEAGTGFVSGPLTDCAKNIGDTPIKLLIHEIYRSRE